MGRRKAHGSSFPGIPVTIVTVQVTLGWLPRELPLLALGVLSDLNAVIHPPLFLKSTQICLSTSGHNIKLLGKREDREISGGGSNDESLWGLSSRTTQLRVELRDDTESAEQIILIMCAKLKVLQLNPSPSP